MKLAFFMLAATLSGVANSQAAGFKNGNQIEITPIQGYATARCQQGNYQTTRTVFCRAYDVEPGTHDYFVNESRVVADKVFLSARHEDGSTTEKDSKYDSSKGQSKSRFNLVIDTITQKPLLDNGLNQVSFRMTQNNQLVTEGSFEANVNQNSPRSCASRYLGFLYNCNDTYRICDDYFYFQNSCR